jgi:outer membrane protein assembly factor BamD
MHGSTTKQLLATLSLTLLACASRGPAFDAMDPEALFQYAMTQYAERDWDDAEAAFQRFVLQYPNHPRVAEARYRIGETYVGRKEYVTAAIEFNRLASEFPTGPFADDARFQVCQAYYRLSPKPALDQEYTSSAIDHCNNLITYYPDSDFVARAREMMAELTNKLAHKEYLIGDTYFRRGAYHSANISFERVAAEYAASAWAPRALLRLFESYNRLRYDPEAQAVKERLLKDYPNSPEARQLGGSVVGP